MFYKFKNDSEIYLTILAVIVARLIFYSTLQIPKLFPDSLGYLNFPFRDMLQLKFTSGRTPIYPLIIRICYFLFGEKVYLNVVVILQIIVSLISVIYFHKICILLVENTKLRLFVTLCYGLSSSIAGYDSGILTESFALSGTVFFLYLMLMYIQTRQFKYGILSISLVLILTFLRPSFLLFDFLLLIFWILRMLFNKNETRQHMGLLICSGVAFLLIGTYSYFFSLQHEIFSISDPVPRQKLIISMERGYYKSSSDEEFIKMIEKSLAINDNNMSIAMRSVLDHFGNKKVLELTKECVEKNRAKNLRDTLEIMSNNSSEIFPGYHSCQKTIVSPYFQYFSKIVIILENIFSIFKVSHVYFFILLELIMMVFLWVIQKEPPWFHMGLFAFPLTIVVSSYILTCAEYPRTMICVLPFMYLSMLLLLDRLTSNSAKEKT